MKLENQVTNLELSKKLKKLGVKQDSLFYWVLSKAPKLLHNNWLIVYNDCSDDILLRNDKISAFTVAELGEMLPDANCFQFENKKYGWVDCGFVRFEGVWNAWIGRGDYGEEIKWEEEADTEANARAKMLIYLIENKLK